jgi:hypothetical protein
LRWWEVRICKAADRDRYEPILITFFRVVKVGPAYGAESKTETGALISSANIFTGFTSHPIIWFKPGKGCEDAAGALLAGEAVADADTT